MKLRTKLVALSLLTLLLPWSGWKLLQELERFLREAQEGAQLTTARTLAGALPVGIQTQLLFLPELYVPLRVLSDQPALDGYADDWPHPGQGLRFSSGDDELHVNLLAGSHGGRLYLLFDVSDEGSGLASPLASPFPEVVDGISLLLRNPRGLFTFGIRAEAPGPLQLRSERDGAGQAEGYWRDREGGYRVELALPISPRNTSISFQVRDSVSASPGNPQDTIQRTAGPMVDPAQPSWVSLVEEWQDLSDWLSSSEAVSARTWLVDKQGWVLAVSGERQAHEGVSSSSSEPPPRTTWVQRLIYRLVAGSRTELLDKSPADPIRMSDAVVDQVLAGNEAVRWTQDLDTAMVWNTVAVPVVLEGEVRGAIVTQSSSDGLLLVTNRALGRLLFTTLALTIGLAAGLWYFATRLSRRVQRLSKAVSHAMEDGVDTEVLPLHGDRDELGDLARNNQKLLRAVADYSQYLQTLASKLSHELKTPLAITRSSLDNLSSQQLDPESLRFLERAREGVDRQAAIVRAMSEASRLEAAIGVAEWETVDLAELVRRCAEGYRSVYQGRHLETELPADKLMFHCAPDLLAQALDKLVDNAMTLSSDEDEVSVRLRSVGDQLQMSVVNSGSSLPEELGDRLFDSLVSVREKRGAAPHLGLGLHIVRLVAAAHGGDVTARNLRSDAGVEFTLNLPNL